MLKLCCKGVHQCCKREKRMGYPPLQGRGRPVLQDGLLPLVCRFSYCQLHRVATTEWLFACLIYFIFCAGLCCTVFTYTDYPSECCGVLLISVRAEMHFAFVCIQCLIVCLCISMFVSSKNCFYMFLFLDLHAYVPFYYWLNICFFLRESCWFCTLACRISLWAFALPSVGYNDDFVWRITMHSRKGLIKKLPLAYAFINTHRQSHILSTYCFMTVAYTHFSYLKY